MSHIPSKIEILILEHYRYKKDTFWKYLFSENINKIKKKEFPWDMNTFFPELIEKYLYLPILYSVDNIFIRLNNIITRNLIENVIEENAPKCNVKAVL